MSASHADSVHGVPALTKRLPRTLVLGRPAMRTRLIDLLGRTTSGRRELRPTWLALRAHFDYIGRDGEGAIDVAAMTHWFERLKGGGSGNSAGTNRAVHLPRFK